MENWIFMACSKDMILIQEKPEKHRAHIPSINIYRGLGILDFNFQPYLLVKQNLKKCVCTYFIIISISFKIEGNPKNAISFRVPI